MTIGFTASVADRVAGLRFADLPADVVELTRQCVLDWFGVTLAGASEPAAAIVLADLLEEGPDLLEQGTGGTGVAVVGRPERLGPYGAALANGTASHALDYDDVNPAMMGHPTVAILAALLALGERRGCTGDEVVCAFVAGYEAQCRVAQAVGHAPYQRGFHATGTVGTFGAAAACARLLGLDPDRTATALGIAATQAAGLKAMFGTMSKPLHAGKACANGLLAARLAARGFTAHQAAVEAEQGFAETEGGDINAAWIDREPHNGWFLRGNLFKYHAACFATHSTIEGLRRLRARTGFDADQVDEVVVHASASQLRMCAIPEPRTGLETKFSLRHLAAMALSDVDTSNAESFTDAGANDDRLVRLRQRVTVAPDGSERGPTAVDVVLRDGQRLSVAHDVSVPATDLDEQAAAVRAKFDALSIPVLGPARTARLAELTAELDRLPDIAGLMRASQILR